MPFWKNLTRYGAQEALITADKQLTYAQLAEAICERMAQLRACLPREVSRPLVALEMANRLDPVINYLAALQGGWPVILLEPGAAEGKALRCLETFRPNLLLRAEPLSRPEIYDPWPCVMHADLRLLLSTSGTTGAPKLVRLSASNLTSNAHAISEYLKLDQSERAATSLPLHYSYGLSVLHSHLSVGATLVLTEHSLQQDAFWREAEGATSLALVPAQAEIVPPAGLVARLPKLRYVTQAGGRLPPDQVREFARVGAEDGWSFFVMYGQTEAAPRMAYLPPEHAEIAADAIGQAIPGGTLHLEDADGREVLGAGSVGELIYRGPNVMMGYGRARDDLLEGAVTDALHTGDLAMRTSDGFFKITGRKSRFIKPFGLRVGLDDVEAVARELAGSGYAVGSDTHLAVFLRAPKPELRSWLAARFGLPGSLIHVFTLETAPRLSSGKIDYKTLAEMAEIRIARDGDGAFSDHLNHVLGTEHVDLSKSFSALGGDSLCYLQVQLWLSKRGTVPAGWEDMPLEQVLIRTDAQRAGNASLPVDLVLRVLAICSVIGLHSTHLPLGGGTYLLLVLAGLSVARFQSTALFAGHPTTVLRVMIVPLLLGYLAILIMIHTLRAPVPISWFLLIANFETGEMVKRLQPYWFVCAYVQVLAIICLPFTIRPLREAIAHAPFLAGMIALMASMLVFEWLGLGDLLGGLRHRHPAGALQLALVGWCVHFAKSLTQKVAVLGLSGLVFALGWHDVSALGWAFLGLGVVALTFRTRIAAPASVFRALTVLGGVTMVVYLVHPIFVSFALARGLPDAVSFGAVLTGSFATAFAIRRGADLLRRLSPPDAFRWRKLRS